MVRAILAQGRAFSQVGRFEEAQKTLADALSRAKQIQNDELEAEALLSQGDQASSGSLPTARQQYQQSGQIAKRVKLNVIEFTSRLNLATLDVKGNRLKTPDVFVRLRDEATRLGLSYESAQCLLLAGEVELNRNQYKNARTQLNAAVEQGERLGSLTLTAQAHYLLTRTSPCGRRRG